MGQYSAAPVPPCLSFSGRTASPLSKLKAQKQQRTQSGSILSCFCTSISLSGVSFVSRYLRVSFRFELLGYTQLPPPFLQVRSSGAAEEPQLCCPPGRVPSLRTVDDPGYTGESGIWLSTLVSTGADLQFVLQRMAGDSFVSRDLSRFVSFLQTWLHLCGRKGFALMAGGLVALQVYLQMSPGEWRAMRSFRVTFRVSFRLYSKLGSLAGERASPWWPAGCSKFVSKDLLVNGG